MGFAASSARLYMLVARKSDLELHLQFINQARLQVANMMSSLFMVSANLEPESDQAKAIQMRIAAIQQWDKMLEIQANRINNQHQAVQTEIQAVQKVIQKNISMSFGLMGQA